MNVKPHIVSSFLSRCMGLGLNVALLDNSTEELRYAQESGKRVNLFAKGLNLPRRSPGARIEENYLYSSNRFPAAANNTIGAGAVPAGTYTFFGTGIGGDGATVGFPTGTKLTDVETNLEGIGGQVAKGTNFVFNQLGVSFNESAVAADVAQLLEVGALRFVKGNGQFTLFHGKASFWPGGTGVRSGSTTIAANGSPDIRAVRTLKIPRVVRENETFGYQFVVPSANLRKNGTATALSDFLVMTVWLWGGHQVAIQT